LADGRGQGKGFTAPAQPKSSERTIQEDLKERSEEEKSMASVN